MKHEVAAEETRNSRAGVEKERLPRRAHREVAERNLSRSITPWIINVFLGGTRRREERVVARARAATCYVYWETTRSGSLPRRSGRTGWSVDRRAAAGRLLLFLGASGAAVGDTTSVSRTPKDEQQQPIPRFIGLFTYMLQGCARQVTPLSDETTRLNSDASSFARVPCSSFPFRAETIDRRRLFPSSCEDRKREEARNRPRETIHRER